ncbi:DUF192 domain-containing protein [Sphingomonas sp. ID0503]|uniref:DUF192 domain-containing protein n=1 Tax=Sphingomonas sp. ID0503 TaxID=3399691 RepID=UPI003AFB2851
MNHRLLIILGGALLAACSAGQAQPSSDPPSAALRSARITIATATQSRAFNVELAVTPQEQARGLMYRTSLRPGHGMLFPFSPPRPASFWMKNTLIPLDLIFIRADGTIAQISPDATPQSLDLIECAEPVAAVLEIAGGEAARLGIAPGDRVTGPGA